MTQSRRKGNATKKDSLRCSGRSNATLEPPGFSNAGGAGEHGRSAVKLVVGERVTVARIEHMRVDAVHDDGSVHLISATATWAGPQSVALKMMRLATALKLAKSNIT